MVVDPLFECKPVSYTHLTTAYTIHKCVVLMYQGISKCCFPKKDAGSSNQIFKVNAYRQSGKLFSHKLTAPSYNSCSIRPVIFNIDILRYKIFKRTILPVLLVNSVGTVSYTHLDVYKRQVYIQIKGITTI